MRMFHLSHCTPTQSRFVQLRYLCFSVRVTSQSFIFYNMHTFSSKLVHLYLPPLSSRFSLPPTFSICFSVRVTSQSFIFYNMHTFSSKLVHLYLPPLSSRFSLPPTFSIPWQYQLRLRAEFEFNCIHLNHG